MSMEPNSSIPTEASQDEHVVSVKHLLEVLRRRLWVVVLVAVVLAGSMVGFDLLRTPIYEAKIKILVGQERGDDASSSLGSDVQGLQQITKTMAELVKAQPVAEAVIEELNLESSPEDFLKNLSVKQVGTTELIEVSYEDASPNRAQQIVNAVGPVFSEQVSEVSPSANSITATVWEKARVPESPMKPNPLRDGLLALVVGGMLGVGLVFLLEHLDDRWRSPEEAEQLSGAPTFAVIQKFEVPKSVKKGEG